MEFVIVASKIFILAQKTSQMWGASHSLHYITQFCRINPLFKSNPIDIFTHLHFLPIFKFMGREIY